MTSTTTDSRRRKSRLGLLWPLSLLVHGLLFVVLLVTGVLKVDLSFNRELVKKETVEKAKARREREKRIKSDREKRKLAEPHKRQLTREIERKPKDRLRRELKRLAEIRRKMQEVKKTRLQEVTQRTKEDYREHLADRLVQEARVVEKFAKNHLHWHKDEPHQRAADQAAQAIEMAEKLKQSPDDDQLAGQMAELGKKLLESSRDALRKEKGVEADADVDHNTLPRNASQLAKTADELNNPPPMSEFNDVSRADWQGDQSLSNEELAKAAAQPPSDLYELARGIEKETAHHYQDARSGELAIDQNMAYNEAADKLQTKGGDPAADLFEMLGAHTGRETIGDMNRYRDALEQAVGQIKSAADRGEFLLAQARGRDGGESSAFVSAAMGAASRGGGGGGGGGTEGLLDHVSQAGGASMPPSQRRSQVRVDSKQVLAQALPGRRFSKENKRQGWLYVNTWYIIGPWENGGAIEFRNTHPPEYEIDFDAEYLDGKKGTFPTSTGDQATLDGTLKWRFSQSDCIRILPYVQAPDSTFYAYTELYFDEATDIVFGIPSDDCTRVWLNRELVWEEFGQSGWGLSESFCKVRFKQGTNTVLVRLENGPHETQFSLFVCPQDAIR